MWQKARAILSNAYDNYYEKYDWFYIGKSDAVNKDYRFVILYQTSFYLYTFKTSFY